MVRPAILYGSGDPSVAEPCIGAPTAPRHAERPFEWRRRPWTRPHEDGAVLRRPASKALPTYDTRVTEGIVEIRKRA